MVARWRGLAAFIPAFVATGVLEEAFVYQSGPGECDPFCSSPLSGLVFAAPLYLVAIAAGALLSTLIVMDRGSRR